MPGLLAAIGTGLLNLLTGDLVGRAIGMVEKKIDNENDRERIKAEVVKVWLQNRMALPWWLDALFIVPLATWFAAVVVYSILFHANGPFPVPWDIAALPKPLDDWAGAIVMARFAPAMIQKFFGGWA